MQIVLHANKIIFVLIASRILHLIKEFARITIVVRFPIVKLALQVQLALNVFHYPHYQIAFVSHAILVTVNFVKQIIFVELVMEDIR